VYNEQDEKTANIVSNFVSIAEASQDSEREEMLIKEDYFKNTGDADELKKEDHYANQDDHQSIGDKEKERQKGKPENNTRAKRRRT